jgi:uncharacterized protein (DUF2141 family)
MNKVLVIFIGLMLISNYAFSQYNLEIEISGIKNDEGKILLQLFDENQKVLTQEMGLIIDKKCTISLKNLKQGKYAIRYFHDENLNGVMETNNLGKPTEGYGFSNNVTVMFGPPSFEKWLFEIKGDKKLILQPVY